MTWSEIAPIAMPVIIIQLLLQAAALFDIFRRGPQRLRGGRRWPWAAMLIFGLLGVLGYFLFGRQD